MSAISKAIDTADRSYHSAKASVSARTEDVMATGPTGAPFGREQKMESAKQQLDAFRSWVYSAIRPIANTVAAQPVIVEKGSTTGTKAVRQLSDHPILRMINNPNDIMTGYGLMWSTVASIQLCGRAFWWMPDNTDELHLIPVNWIKGHTGTASFESWLVMPPGNTEPIPISSERMVYFSMPDPSDPFGSISPTQACASAINNDHDILTSQRSSFTRGLHPSHAILVGSDASPDGSKGGRPRLSPAQVRQITTAIKKRYAGTAKHGEPLLLDSLIKDIKQLSHSPSEMDWTASADAMKRRILTTYGTSEYIIGGTEPGSRAASAVARKHFVQQTINPLVRLMNASLQEWLGRPNNVTVRIELCTADDEEMLLRKAEILAKFGSIKANELRTLLGLEEDNEFAGMIVTPRNKLSGGQIENGIRDMISEQFGGLEADKILARVNGSKFYDREPSGNGKRI